MTEKKRMGRPPAEWMFELAQINVRSTWIDAYEIAELYGLNINTVKSHLVKLNVSPKHLIENGRAKAKYKTTELKQAARKYIDAWL